MGKYAEKTNVSVARSKTDIEAVLDRYGAAGFSFGKEDGRAVIGFRLMGKYVRFNLSLPNRTEFFLSNHDPPRKRNRAQVDAAFEQACRSRWRSLFLVIRAKLEAVETGITSFEEEFLAHLMLPSGETVGQVMLPQVELAYADGTMPKLLPYGGPR